MIKRLVVELTEALCNCPPGTQMALDIETSKKDDCYELQASCIQCKSYIATPLPKLRALIRLVGDNTPPTNTQGKRKPNLVLLQGGASVNNSPNEIKKISS